MGARELRNALCDFDRGVAAAAVERLAVHMRQLDLRARLGEKTAGERCCADEEGAPQRERVAMHDEVEARPAVHRADAARSS
jgi:hypothetical protein